MWWKYGDPPFILSPKHAVVLRAAAARLSDNVGWEEWEDDWPGIGIVVFDNLSQGQKQTAILEAARALLDPSVEPPRVTAVLAGTVDAIYRELQASIETEISLAEDITVRSMVIDAMDEANYWEEINSALEPGEEAYQRLSPDCKETDQWAELVESLRTQILEDYDFDMEDKFLDMPPAKAAALKKRMNILPDYFTAVPEDPKPERLAEMARELRSLLW